MSLFGFGKKKKEEPKVSCGCDSNRPPEKNTCCCTSADENSSACCSGTVTGISCIKVLGAGCKSCHELYENVQQATKNLRLPVEVEYITDMKKVITYGVMSLPAIVVNDQVISIGKVLKTADVEKLLRKVGA